MIVAGLVLGLATPARAAPQDPPPKTRPAPPPAAAQPAPTPAEVRPAPRPAETRPAPPAAEAADARPEPAGSRACDGQGRRGWMLRQSVLGLTNPIGAVAETRVGWCRPLVERPGVLWMLTQVEPGVLAFLTPSFLRAGGYVDLAPLSFLVLRLAVTGVWYWPLPGFRAAAYFDAQGDDLRWSSNGITNEIHPHKEHGGGLNVSAAVVLRGAVPLARLRHGPLELIALNSLAVEYWYLGTYDYYYNQRADAVLARSDVALVNNAALLLGFPLTRKVGMRVGVTDSLTFLPRRGRLATQQVGALLMWPLTLAGRRLAALTPFTRITAYTNHYTRQLTFDWNLLLGVELALRL